MSDWTPDLARLQAFDDAEWLRVERNYCGRLMAYVGRRISDMGAREDIVQEAFLGAVRGIGEFDPMYTFEQYLFGICKNRTIDHLRRRRTPTLKGGKDPDDSPGMETFASTQETPSRIVRGHDLAAAGRRLLQQVLCDWVQETWHEGEFVRLMVIEALFAGGWRNRDTWRRFDLRDETSVAGIKFRALKRLREMAQTHDPSSNLLDDLASALTGADQEPTIDVGESWRSGRVSCPARHWLARLHAGAVPEGPNSFLRFHLDEMKCEWCQANLDDLAKQDEAHDLEPLLGRMGASTLQYLRSRTVR